MTKFLTAAVFAATAAVPAFGQLPSPKFAEYDAKFAALESRVAKLEGKKLAAMPPAASGITFEATPYAEVRSRVEAGENIFMLVKTDPGNTVPVRVGFTTLRCDDAPLAAGRYECFMGRTGPVMNVVASGVAGASPFGPAAGTSGSTPATTARRAAGRSLSLNGSLGMGFTRTGAGLMGLRGSTSGCGPAGCPAR